MSDNTVSVTLEQSDLDYAESLVDQGLYASLTDAVLGEFSVARVMREEQDRMLFAEVERRLELPHDQYIRIDSPTYFSDRFKAKHGLDEKGT